MLKNQNIICISSIDWDFIWQGHQEIMSTFARNGNRVLFIENTGIRFPKLKDIQRLKKRVINWFNSTRGFREERKNLYVYSPVSLPFPYSRLACWINRRLFLGPIKNWMKITEFYDPIIWTFLPTRTALDLINNIEKKLVVYYCIADFAKLTNNPRALIKTEEEVIRKSDLIFVQGKILQEKCKKFNSNVHIFPFGVSIKIFKDVQYDLEKAPSDLNNIKKPIIGYIGGIHKHIDYRLLRFIAKEHPDWSIVLVGPIQTETLGIDNLPNVFLLGKKDFSDLPHYIHRFDVCIIPYNKTEYTATVYPTKLNEYHALGKPVVSTDLPEILNFNLENNNLVLVGRTYQEFTDCISQAINDSDAGTISRRMRSAKENNWVDRIEEMNNLMEDAIEKKLKVSLNWRENFLKLYTIARRNLLNLTVICASVYLLIFYTPLVWILAEPLKISQPPQKADAIVVFAGGVGESGQPGQGYEERTQAAVELYRSGYARAVIFSSGYMYVFKEPLIMRALAISLGLPKEAIILEDRARNTYENVKFINRILEDRGWNNILLVSSPYHMKRVSLVFKKIAPDVKITYTPILKSRFYIHARDINIKGSWKQISLSQIKGILHEYLGILYYWFKGYI